MHRISYRSYDTMFNNNGDRHREILPTMKSSKRGLSRPGSETFDRDRKASNL